MVYLVWGDYQVHELLAWFPCPPLRSLALMVAAPMSVAAGLKFAANLSWMFTECGDLPARYSAARQAGFTGVECAFPYDQNLETLVSAKEASGLTQVLINSWPGDRAQGYMGLAALPNHEDVFKMSLEQSAKYAKALHCTRMHVMAGMLPREWKDSAMDEIYLENIRYAADWLQKEGITALIEPVNTQTMPGYFLHNPDKAVEVIKKVNHPNLKLQLDIYHLQMLTGNLTENIKKYLPYTDHVQIGQVPNRHEPDSPGEVNYQYVFQVLEEAGYDGWVGLEYTPLGSTVDGLKWMSKMKY